MLHISCMLKQRTALSIILILALSGYVLPEGQGNHSQEEVTVKAHYKEGTEERLFASGDVEIHYRDIVIFADTVEFFPKTMELVAEGNVVIQMPEEVVSARWVRVNLETLQGEMQDVMGRAQPTLLFEARSFKQESRGFYRFQKAMVTTCTQPVPRWSFSCSRGNLKKNAYVEMWNSVIRIKNIPVFYLPYFRYPLREERSTGFLMPQLGHSDQKGFSVSQGFYWAIKRNMDATFTLDFFSAKGIGAGLEYRYLLSQDSGGEVNAYYFTYRKEQGSETPPPSYLLRFKHNQNLPLDFSVVVDVDLQSSYGFLKEFDNNFERAVVWNRKSEIFISRGWSSYTFSLRASRFETYFPAQEKSAVIYNLPQVHFSSFKKKIFSPLYFSFSSSFRRWSQRSLDGSETHAQTLAFSPVFTLPFTSIPWLFVNTSLAGNFQYSFDQVDPLTQQLINRPYFSKSYVLDVELTGPTFYRVYWGSEGSTKVKHLLEPSVVYRYESPVSNRVVSPDYQASFRLHDLTYGLTNRFLVKRDDSPREILSLSLEQTYSFSPETSPLNIYRVNGKIPEFSDIRGTLRFYPASQYSLDLTAALNPYYMTLSGFRIGASLGSGEDPWFFRLNWFRSVNPYNTDTAWNRHQLSSFAGVKLPRLSLEAQAEVSYNIQERKLLYSALRFVYRYQCVDFRGDIRLFYFREKPELQFRVSFGLGDIGKTIDMLGGMGF